MSKKREDKLKKHKYTMEFIRTSTGLIILVLQLIILSRLFFS